MNHLTIKALETIKHRITSMSGCRPDLFHPDDNGAAAELFVRMNAHGIPLVPEEIESWAQDNGWLPRSAQELGELARKVNAGEALPASQPPFWNENIIEILNTRSSAATQPHPLMKKECGNCMMQGSDKPGRLECLMEVMSRQWVELLCSMACCNFLETGQLLELTSFPQIIPL